MAASRDRSSFGVSLPKPVLTAVDARFAVPMPFCPRLPHWGRQREYAQWFQWAAMLQGKSLDGAIQLRISVVTQSVRRPAFLANIRRGALLVATSLMGAIDRAILGELATQSGGG